MKKTIFTLLLLMGFAFNSVAKETPTLKIIVSRNVIEPNYLNGSWVKTNKSFTEHLSIPDYERGGALFSGKTYTYTKSISPIVIDGQKNKEITKGEIQEGISIFYDKSEAKIVMNYDVFFPAIRQDEIAQTPSYKTLTHNLALKPAEELTKAFSDDNWTIYYSLQ